MRQKRLEVEVLVALENIAYSQPKYRPEVGDIMDILFRKRVIEAVAVGEWSQMATTRTHDKQKLINEIYSSGFTVLRRSPSV